MSRVIPDTKAVVRTRPLEALIIGSYVRGLSDRDIESLAEEAELGHVSKTTVSRICREPRDRYTAFCNKSPADLNVMALFLDATPLDPAVRRKGCRWPGATPPRANACWWRSDSGNVSRTKIGWISAAI